jgi:hypothetical protein
MSDFPTERHHSPYDPAMAKTTVVITTDDLDGSTRDVSTYRFGWLGRDYEIDLSAKNYKAFEAALAPYVGAGRIQPRSGSKTSPATAGRDYDLNELRAWAAANDIEIPSRGRIPGAIVEQFKNR